MSNVAKPDYYCEIRLSRNIKGAHFAVGFDLESILETKAATILQFLGGLRGSLLVTFEERNFCRLVV